MVDIKCNLNDNNYRLQSIMVLGEHCEKTTFITNYVGGDSSYVCTKRCSGRQRR